MANLLMGGCVTPMSIMLDVLDPIRATFEPKSSKIGQEMAELWPIY